MDISGNLQQKMWREMDEFLNEHRTLPPRELCKQCFLWMFYQLERYPMLKQVDNETAEHLYRKLPPEVLAAHTRDDSHELIKLEEYGIHLHVGSTSQQKNSADSCCQSAEPAAGSDRDRQIIMEIILM